MFSLVGKVAVRFQPVLGGEGNVMKNRSLGEGDLTFVGCQRAESVEIKQSRNEDQGADGYQEISSCARYVSVFPADSSLRRAITRYPSSAVFYVTNVRNYSPTGLDRVAGCRLLRSSASCEKSRFALNECYRS